MWLSAYRPYTVAAPTNFDFYVSPSGSSTLNAGTLLSPWGLDAVNRLGANYKSQTAGHRIGLLPGVYDPVALGTQPNSFTRNFIELPPGTVGNITYVASSDVAGNEIPAINLYNAGGGGTWNGATIDGTNETTVNNPQLGGLIGCGLNGSGSANGYVTISGLEVRKGISNMMVMYGDATGHRTNGFSIQNCWGHSSANSTNGINPGPVRMEYCQGPYLGNNYFETFTDTNNRAAAVFIWASSDGVFEFNTIVAPSITGSPAGNPLFDYKAQGHFGHTFRYNYIDGSNVPAAACFGCNDYGTQSTDPQYTYGNVFVGGFFMANQESDGLYWPSSNRYFYNNTFVGVGSSVIGPRLFNSPAVASIRFWNNILTRAGVFTTGDIQTSTGGILRADYNCYGATSGGIPQVQWRVNSALTANFGSPPNAGSTVNSVSSSWSSGTGPWQIQLTETVSGNPENRSSTMTNGSTGVDWSGSGGGPLTNNCNQTGVVFGVFAYPTNTTLYSGLGTGAGNIGSINAAYEAHSVQMNPLFTGTGTRAQQYQLQGGSPLKNLGFVWSGDTITSQTIDLGAWGLNPGRIGSNLKG